MITKDSTNGEVLVDTLLITCIIAMLLGIFCTEAAHFIPGKVIPHDMRKFGNNVGAGAVLGFLGYCVFGGIGIVVKGIGIGINLGGYMFGGAMAGACADASKRAPDVYVPMSFDASLFFILLVISFFVTWILTTIYRDMLR